MSFLHGEGAYIVFEGGEGSGKSTHSQRLAESLQAHWTREPGATGIGRKIREITHDTSHTTLSPIAEALLMAADRAQHIHEVVQPVVRSGRHVVSDRSWISSLIYQGEGRLLGRDVITKITELAIAEFMNHDLTILIDIPYETQIQRLSARSAHLDRFEQESAVFHQRVLLAYLKIAHDLGAVVINGTDQPDVVYKKIRKTVKDKLGL